MRSRPASGGSRSTAGAPPATPLGFLGETVLAFAALVRGRARFRRVDLLHAFEVTGVGALAIVALINFLIGAVLAFVGAVQLQPFGAAIYVANLVAIAVDARAGPADDRHRDGRPHRRRLRGGARHR